ncbi:MAG TPA: S41 family peptidase [Gemmatimonadales bacterium]
MPRLTLRRVTAALAIATPLVLGGFILGRRTSDTGFHVFQAVFSVIGRESLDSLPNDSLYESAARGMVAGLDDAYADLFSPEEYARFNRNQLRNRYGGVGLRILTSGGWVTVWRVIEGGPAQAAGIQRGDKIVAVGDSSAQGWSIDRVSSNLTGTPGTNVKVTIERSGQRQSFEITRAIISLPAVSFTTMLDGNVGYIPFNTSFSDRSAHDVGAAVRSLQDAGAQSIILDMRGNPGGSLDQAVQLSSVFIDQNAPVVEVKSRREDDTLRAPGPPAIRAGIPVAVLIDGNSASASEIVAGALQDYDRALLVGTTSYGKGLVQGGYPLPEGWVLKLTTAHWFTPSGRLIQKTHADSARPDSLRPKFRSASGRELLGGGGIVPDVVVGGDTLTTGELAMGRLLAAKATQRDAVVDAYVTELTPRATPGYVYDQHWTPELLRRLRAGGFEISDQVAREGAHYLERLLDGRLSSYALSDADVFARNSPKDVQLQRAAERLRHAHSQQELLTMAMTNR